MLLSSSSLLLLLLLLLLAATPAVRCRRLYTCSCPCLLSGAFYTHRPHPAQVRHAHQCIGTWGAATGGVDTGGIVSVGVSASVSASFSTRFSARISCTSC
jgi:hypothetical protein